MIFYFFFIRSDSHGVLHSFPTRRSSDLERPGRTPPRRAPRGGDPPPADRRRDAADERPRAGPAPRAQAPGGARSEEHTSELQSHVNLVCRLLLEKKKQPSKVIRA